MAKGWVRAGPLRLLWAGEGGSCQFAVGSRPLGLCTLIQSQNALLPYYIENRIGDLKILRQPSAHSWGPDFILGWSSNDLDKKAIQTSASASYLRGSFLHLGKLI